MSPTRLAVLSTFFCVVIAIREVKEVDKSSSARLVTQSGEADEGFWDTFQSDLSSVKSATDAFRRFAQCERIAIVMEGDANRPDIRTNSLMWIDFLKEQGYCIAYFFDWQAHASDAWGNLDITTNFGFGWKDALKEVKQADEGQVIQILNSTKENWKEFTSKLGAFCREACPAKRVVMSFLDHGEYRLLGLPEHKMLLREDILDGLRYLYSLSPDVKLLSYVSACKAGSIFGGPQYTAKELLQSHYIDCDLRSEDCQQGVLTSQVATIAGHSIVGRKQRSLLRAMEGLLEAQAMCDLATGDDVPGAAIAKMISELPEKDRAKREVMMEDSQDKSKDNDFKTLVAFFAQGGNMKEAPSADNVFQPRLQKGFERVKHLSVVFEAWKYVATTLHFDTPEYLKTAFKGLSNDTIALEVFQGWHDEDDEEDTEEGKIEDFDVAEAVNSIREVDPNFAMSGCLAEKDLRESTFMQLFNKEVLSAWFELRLAVDAWKADTTGYSFWQKLSNGTNNASVANKASAKVPWGVDCGTMSECLGTFGRGQIVTKLHDKELGCLPEDLATRWEGHILASSQAGDEGIEENGGLEDSHMGDHLTHLLRAIAYSSDDELEGWDTQLKSQRGMLATGDFDYEEDPMWGTAIDPPEPLDLMKDLYGSVTRPESVLAFSASIPQIISSSLLPFSVGSISDIRDRLKSKAMGEEVDTSFRAHVRSVEDFAINKDSLDMDMMFGMYTKFLKLYLQYKGNEDATLSITGKDAAARAEKFQLLADSSWFKASKKRKAEFYQAISEGILPPGFLSLKYVSPASGREIMRYFDTQLSAENFGSPIAFGNMMDTDIHEFFHHVPSGMEAFKKRMTEIGKAILGTFQFRGKPQQDEQSRCCCKGPEQCKLLVGNQLKKSKNIFKWGQVCCPTGYRHYQRFGLKERPKSCSTNGVE